MSRTRIFLSLWMLLAITLLAACGPSQDDKLAPLATQAAQTLQAVSAVETAMQQVAMELTGTASVATITPPPTLPPAATNTPGPTLPAVGTPSGAKPPAAAGPAATQPAAAAAGGADRGDFVNQSISDGTRLSPGQEFTMTWTLANKGSSTWTSDYYAAYASGEKLATVDKVNIPRSISPDMVVEISVKMKAPTTLGKYKTEWTLYNNRGEVFGLGQAKSSFWLEIEVANIPTATATTAVTSAVTNTPTSDFITGAAISAIDGTTGLVCNAESIITISGSITAKKGGNITYSWVFSGTNVTVPAAVTGQNDSIPDSGTLPVGPINAKITPSQNGKITVQLRIDSPQSFTGPAFEKEVTCN